MKDYESLMFGKTISPPRKWTKRILLLLMLGGIVLLGLWWRYRETNGHLEAVVEFRSSVFYITNAGKKPWSHVEVSLNRHPRYYPQATPLAIDRLLPGKALLLPLSEFRTSGGTPFYLNDRIQSLLIKANVGGRKKTFLKVYF